MSQLDREGLISQSNFLFPDNTTREITPADLRTFNTDVADSLTITGSNVISASYADASGFASSSDWSGINNIPGGLVSGSSQIILQDTTGDLSGSRIDGAVALATTASHALFSEEAENAEHADAVQFPVIAKETLTKGDPVYVSGYNSGEGKPEVLKADASDSSKMPVVGLAMVNASNNDHIFIAVAGNFSDVDTDTGLTSPSVGDTLYVASGGGYTNVKPTGTNLIQNIGVIGRVQQNNGEIVVSAIQRSNDLPNIQDGYTWVGDGSGVPQAVATSSFAGATIDTGSFATTGSNVFVGDQTISGSTLTEVNTQGITSLTASVDFSDTSLFELTLGSGVDTHIDASNIGRGQTINVLITQDATSAGTLSFSPKFLQPSGSEYTATTTLSGQDILTFITYNDTSKVYVVATNKFE